MIKEELEKEAEEWLSITDNHLNDERTHFLSESEYAEQAYLAGAEPREKQIQIDAEQIRALQKDKGNLTDRVTDLEAQLEREKNLNQCLSDHNEQLREQIEKMKNCRNCKKEKIEGACGHFTQVGWCKNWELVK